MGKKILLATNGCGDSWSTIQYAAGIAALMGWPITLLGVVEEMDERHPVEEIFSRAVTLFQEQKLDYELHLVNGEAEDVLANMNWDEDTYLFVGPLGRSQFRHWLVGRSFRKILEAVPRPIFYTRESRYPIKNILVCFGGLGYAGMAEEISIEVGKLSGAALTFLHVVPPLEAERLPLQEFDEEQKLPIDAESAHILRAAQQDALDNGIISTVVVRHGNVVNQILAELKSKEYDLICMGSSFSDPDNLRHLYAPNVTAEIAEAADCPILTARNPMRRATSA